MIKTCKILYPDIELDEKATNYEIRKLESEKHIDALSKDFIVFQGDLPILIQTEYPGGNKIFYPTLYLLNQQP